MPDATATAFAQYRNCRHFPFLDGLRCLSICAVLWHHSPLPGIHSDATVLTRGFLGVNLFFLISGFLITTLLLREEATSGKIDLRGFYARRAIRILPPYLLVVTAVALYYGYKGGEHDAAGLAIYYYAFLSNFLNHHLPLLEPTWSLSVEEQYYLVWPVMLCTLAIWRTSARSLFTTLAIAFFVAHETGLLADWTPEPIATQHATFGLRAEGYSALLIGSLLAMAQHNSRTFTVLHRALGGRWSFLACSLAVATLIALAPPNLRGMPAFAIHLGMAAMLCSLTIGGSPAGSGALRSRPIVRIGQISYGIYLYHMIGLHFANRALERFEIPDYAAAWAVLLLYTVISFASAEASYRYFESPLLKLKARFRIS
jgi:peptidoglycan/LPS O-acetylase OafA/YrhL